MRKLISILVPFAVLVLSGCSAGLNAITGIASGTAFAQPITITNNLLSQNVTFVDVVSPCDPKKSILRLKLSETDRIYPARFSCFVAENFELMVKGYVVTTDTVYVGYTTQSFNAQYPQPWNITYISTR